jgi:hypothetical protein
MWERRNSQEVGLEAAILERVRNSSLVEWSCADNVTGLKPRAEAADFRSAHLPTPSGAGRWEFRAGVVGERRSRREAGV